jgi:hypothetical protein
MNITTLSLLHKRAYKLFCLLCLILVADGICLLCPDGGVPLLLLATIYGAIFLLFHP